MVRKYTKTASSVIENELFNQLVINDFFGHSKEFVREFRFHPVRRWRADFAFVDLKILIECEGGTWTRGRHVRGVGFENDCEKYNAASLGGWLVLRFTSGQIYSGRAIETINQAIDCLTKRRS